LGEWWLVSLIFFFPSVSSCHCIICGDGPTGLKMVLSKFAPAFMVLWGSFLDDRVKTGAILGGITILARLARDYNLAEDPVYRFPDQGTAFFLAIKLFRAD